VSLNRILARLSPEEFALRGRREERSGRNVVLVACLSPHPGRPNGRASRFPGPARRSLVVRDAVLDHLGPLYAQIMTDHPAQSLVIEFGPPIEKWVAREPDNPNAIEALAWLMRLRLKIRKADPRNYAGRKLPDCLTRLLRG
jgi:hypothetical protein